MTKQRLNIPRGYQSQTTLSDGRSFTIGASWSDATGIKNGEIYDPAINTWTELNGCSVNPMLTQDAQGISYPHQFRYSVDHDEVAEYAQIKH